MWVHAGSSVSPAISRHPACKDDTKLQRFSCKVTDIMEGLWNTEGLLMCEHGDNLRVLVWTITTRPKVGRSMWLVTSFRLVKESRAARSCLVTNPRSH